MGNGAIDNYDWVTYGITLDFVHGTASIGPGPDGPADYGPTLPGT